MADISSTPYLLQGGTTDRIAKLLATTKNSVHRTPKNGKTLRSVKEWILFEEKRVYEVLCGDCEKTYIGQTSRLMTTCPQDHRPAVDQGQSTSSLFQHFKQTTHSIDFDSLKSLATVSHYTSRTIQEAIEIERRSHNMNNCDDFIHLARAWKPVTEKILVAPQVRPSQSTVQRPRPSKGQSPGHETISTGKGDPATRTHAASTRAVESTR